MQIHWSIWFLIGLIVTVVSAFMEGLAFFIGVGVVFMAVGIAKFVISPKEAKKRKVPEHAGDKKYLKCPYCSAWNYPHTKHCHYCSRKMP